MEWCNSCKGYGKWNTWFDKRKISDLTNGATIGVAVKKGVDLLGQEQNQKLF